VQPLIRFIWVWGAEQNTPSMKGLPVTLAANRLAANRSSVKEDYR